MSSIFSALRFLALNNIFLWGYGWEDVGTTQDSRYSVTEKSE